MIEKLKELGFKSVEKPSGHPKTFELEVKDKPYTVFAEVAEMQIVDGQPDNIEDLMKSVMSVDNDTVNHVAIYASWGAHGSTNVGISQGIDKPEEEMITCLRNFINAN
jgi:hypothetical protein